MDHLVLARANELEAGAIPDVGKTFPGVRAERALHDQAVLGAIEDATPALELEDAVDHLVRVELHHAPVVDQLAAEHRVGEVHLPAVLRVHIADPGRDTALGHHRVRFAEQRLRDDGHAAARIGRGDCGAHPGAAGADDEHVSIRWSRTARESLPSQKTMCGSMMIPARSRWMYTSVMTTLNMLHHAHTG